MSTFLDGPEYIDGRLVFVDVTMALCPFCHRLHAFVSHDGQFVRLVNTDDTPVMHR